MEIPMSLPRFPRRTTAAVLIAALSWGCWSVPDDDAGDEQFVAWATVAVLGRRPASRFEVDVLAELAAEEGRTAVVDVLMAQPEFAEHWTRVLMDHMQVAREGAEKPDDTTCYTEKRLPSYHYASLVDHLRFQSWKTPFCPSTDPWVASPSTLPAPPRPAPSSFTATTTEQGIREQFERFASAPGDVVRGTIEPRRDQSEFSGALAAPGAPMLGLGVEARAYNCESFTMADVYAAALQQDRLDVLYRAGLVPLATLSSDTGVATSRFLEVYVDRDPGCVSCHSTNYSTTEGAPRNGWWDRFEAAQLVDLESTVFSYNDGSGYHDGALGGTEVGDRVRNLFRGDGWRSSNGIFPFGIDGSCATDAGKNGFATTIGSDAKLPAAFAGLEGTDVGIGHLVDQFAVGVAAHGWDQLEPADTTVSGDAAAGEALYETYCIGCHEGGLPDAPQDLPAFVRYMSRDRVYDTIVNGSPAGLMTAQVDPEDPEDMVAPAGLSLQDASDVATYLTSGGSHVYPQVYTTRAAGFAHLTAMSIVNDVYLELTGAELLMETGFPRNEDAAATLDHLTRVFVDEGWSLQALLRELVDSQFANRRAPADSAGGAYELPMLFQPWADSGPDIAAPGEDLNGQGDLVHRWSVPSLLLQLHHALGWPEPPMFPSSGYADLVFQQELGAPLGVARPGFDDVITSSLLAWEKEVGSCANPGPTPDYIDTLTAPEHGLTVEQAMLAVKDRLVSDARWWGDPSADLGDVVGPDGPQDERTLAGVIATLHGPTLAGLASAAGGEDAVREYCGALLMSPQFLLMGLPAWVDRAPPAPDPAVPCVDDLCTLDDYCDHYAEDADDLGYTLSCGIGGFTSGG
jgi:mono/diheme cytochrome c family protein